MAYILFCIFLVIVARIWRRLFSGTIHGKVVVGNRNILPQQFEDVEFFLTAKDFKKKVRPVLTNVKGEYSFQCRVPVRFYLTLRATAGDNQFISEPIGKIEGVRWLFGIPYFRLPISSGDPIHVDLVISDIPDPNLVLNGKEPNYTIQNSNEGSQKMHTPVHPILNDRWMPVLIVVVSLMIDFFFGSPTEIWSRFFEGTVYGKVVLENRDTDPNRLANIEISWYISDFAKKCKPVLTDANGEYRFERAVPVNAESLSMTAKYEAGRPGYYREVYQRVEGIEGVRRFLGLPISSGVPKRVDFVIPDIPPPIIGK